MGNAVSTGDVGCTLGSGGPQGADPLLPAELLSAEHSAARSPRLSPDGRRLLYLEGGLGGPHRQCLHLRMVSRALQALGTAVLLAWDLARNVTASCSAQPGWGVGSAPNPPASVSLAGTHPQLPALPSSPGRRGRW